MNERHANIPKVIASNYDRYLSVLPGWITDDFIGFLTVVLVQAWHRYDPKMGASLETHLFGCVKLAAKGYWEKFKQQKRAGTLSESIQPSDWVRKSATDQSHELIEARDICKTLEIRLPAEQWRILKHYYLEGKPLKEIVTDVSGYLALKQLREAEKAARKIINV